MTDLSSPPFATRHIGPSEAEQQRMLEAEELEPARRSAYDFGLFQAGGR